MSELYKNRWRILRSLGEGGQAHAFLVEDGHSDAPAKFVLKRLKNVQRRDRFAREIEAVKKLSHSNILPLVDFDIDSEKPFFVSPYAEGGSLADHSEDWKGNPSSALSVILAVSQALGHAHNNGVVHRDIKPANIFLFGDQRRPVLGDFGICYAIDGERLTLTDEAVGARLFIPPELEDGRTEEVTPRSDIYSLGKLLYWLLAGGRVFAREQHRDSRWNLVSLFSNTQFEHINRLLDRMITPQPSERMTGGQEAADVVRYVEDLFRKDARALGPGLVQECEFCKQGKYKEVNLSDSTNLHNFGLAAVSGAQWHAMICEVCGHLQLFRLERATAKKTFWGREERH